MKKIFTKALSVFLAALMCLAVAPAFALAADEQSTPAAPVFALKLVNDGTDEVVVSIVLVENNFKCLDLELDAADDLTLTTITFLNGVSGSSNITNGKISLARPEPYEAELELVTYTYTKASAENVKSEDFEVIITTCGVEIDGVDTDIFESVVVRNEIPDIHEHIPAEEWVETVPATCSTPGTEVRYCTICTEIVETRDTAVTDHLDTTVDEVAATCTEDGYKKVFCNDCQTYIVDEVYPATNHADTTLEEADATCTEDGYKKVFCNDCQTYISEETYPATGHGASRQELVLATCTEDGYVREICTVCNTTVNETILESSGHTLINDIKDPTCTEDGYIRRICTMPNCGHVELSVPTPHTGHHWLAWTVVTAPTYSKTGLERRICDKCGEDQERTIPKLVLAPTELILGQQEIGLYFRGTARLFVNVLPEEAAYSTVIIWESSNPDVATVDENGAVYANSVGTATITARTADGSLSATCEVTVTYSTLQWIIVYILFGWIWYL